MDKSLFPDGVEVHQSALANIGDQAAFHIQRRLADSMRAGRVSGLDLSINASPSKRFNLTAGWGYTARGDFVEITTPVQNFALADYTLNVKNYVVLCYREVPSKPEAHESGGITQNTILTRSSELKVITQAEYDALPASSDINFATDLKTADLTTDAKNRMIVIAVVTGNGGVNYTGTAASASAAATGDFLNGNIVQQQLISVQLTAEVSSPANIPGVNIKRISANTRVGSGKLQLNGSPAEWRLSWSSPDSSGVSENPSGNAGQLFTASSTPLVFTIASETTTPNSSSNETATSITVEVMTDFFPSSGTPFVDTVTISRLYDDTASVFSATDALHRSKQGSYIARQSDPHGTGYPDLAQPVSIIPKPLVVGTELMSTEAQALQARITTNRSSANDTERTLIWQSSGGSNGTIRVYAMTVAGYELTLNAQWNGGIWLKDAGAYSYLYRFDGGLTEYQHTSSTVSATWGDAAWSNSTTLNKGTLTLGSDLIGGSNQQGDVNKNLVPRITANRTDGTAYNRRTLLLDSPVNGANVETSRPLCIWLASGPGTPEGGSCIEFTFNAKWNGYDHWVLTSSGSYAFRVAISSDGLTVAYSTFTEPESYWSDAFGPNDWTLLFRVRASGFHSLGGSLSLTGNIAANGALTGSSATVTGNVNGQNVYAVANIGAQNINATSSVTVATDKAILTPTTGLFLANTDNNAYANTLSKRNIPKAWGTFITVGGNTHNFSESSFFGVNTSTASAFFNNGYAGKAITVTFTTPMANSLYVVVVNTWQSGLAPLFSDSDAVFDKPRYVFVESKSINSFLLYFYRFSAEEGELQLLDPRADSIAADFVVFGDQA